MDKIYDHALQMCQIMIGNCGIDITRELIAEKVDEVLSMPTYSPASEDREKLISELESRFTVWTDNAHMLSSDDQHEKWLAQKSGMIDWRFWNRYKAYLGKSLPQSAVDSVDEITRMILDQMEDPERDGPWDRRGLVMGSVQSGKTANYTGLICKAADAGYKVIIVLAGLHNNLRSQTQIRIDEGFLGYNGAEGNFIATGVGHIDPSLKANTGTNRNDKGDFNTGVAEKFGIHPGGHPLIFVVKKNASILERLLKWIRGSADTTDPETGRKFHTRVPLLVIDDEADQASVDTKKPSFTEEGEPDPDHDPTRINSQIRKLLYSFSKSTYVGYTATPFANVFIYENAKTDDEGPDLFPGSFIINLPPPSNYVGPDKVFGIEEDKDNGLEEVKPIPITRIIRDYAVKRDADGLPDENGWIHEHETEGWMPPRLRQRTGHIPIFEDEERIPPSLEAAIRAFILSCAARKLREGSGIHNSMLIHVVRYTLVQERVATQVSEALTRIKNRLRNAEGNPHETIGDELAELWQSDFVPTNGNPAFEAEPFNGELMLPEWSAVNSVLWETVASIVVRTINGSAADALNYEDHGDGGLNVIAIGGDKLSRGLTLEGLTVSYFLRASKMYDTLMQMGRWFGYRSRYADLCRLYTTEDLVDWFAHIAVAAEELRKEFDYMYNTGGTPRSYGLRVRSHPTMLITSAVKMRSGEEMRLSYAGDISETIIFHRPPEKNRKNLLNTQAWLKTLGDPNNEPGASGSYLWKNVSVETLLDFLDQYESHEDAHRARTDLVSRYIRKQNDQQELKNWSVLLVSNSKSSANNYDFEGTGTIGMIERAQFPPDSQDDRRYTIRRLVSPSDEAKDLTREQRSAALDLTRQNWERNDSRKKAANPPTRPGGFEIRNIRPKEQGMLMLYPLDPAKAGINSEDPIIGISLSFPASDTAQEITYKVTATYRNLEQYEDS